MSVSILFQILVEIVTGPLVIYTLKIKMIEYTEALPWENHVIHILSLYSTGCCCVVNEGSCNTKKKSLNVVQWSSVLNIDICSKQERRDWGRVKKINCFTIVQLKILQNLLPEKWTRAILKYLAKGLIVHLFFGSQNVFGAWF